MEQLVQEVKIFTMDSQEFRDRRDSLTLKKIIDNPTYHNSGRLLVPKGERNNFYELKNVNYIFINSDICFDLLINDEIIINTSQFSFMNDFRYINIAIQTLTNRSFYVDYVYGNLKLGDEGTAMFHPGDYSCVKWDSVLKNVVYDNKMYDNCHNKSSIARISSIEIGV